MTIINKVSMRRQVYNIIKEKMLTQEYDFGDSLNITQLCNELGVSNTPIREALSLLEVEGLVTSTMNSKVKVINITESLFSEINGAVLALIFGSYDLCNYTKKKDQLIQQMTSALALQEEKFAQQDFHGFINAAIAFDRCFISATENLKLIKTFDDISTVLFLLTRYTHQKSEPNRAENIKEHQAILQSVIDDNQELTRVLLCRHYDKHL